MDGAAGKIWVVGPIAMDTVVYFKEPIQHGRYVQGFDTEKRIGGSTANVALAVVSSGVPTSYVSALGPDKDGTVIRQHLEAAGFKDLLITETEIDSNQVIVMVEPDGERTMFGIGPGNLLDISLKGADLSPRDSVVFVGWHDHFRSDLDYARSKGCETFVGIGAVLDPSVIADVAIGSASDLPAGYALTPPLDRFKRIVMTQGESGSRQYSQDGMIFQPAIVAEVVDTTGAGDAFLAGYLVEHYRGDIDGRKSLETGARWAAQMVGVRASVPPPLR